MEINEYSKKKKSTILAKKDEFACEDLQLTRHMKTHKDTTRHNFRIINAYFHEH